MRLSFVMCTLFFLSQGLADNNVKRQKRDMLSIQNFLYSLFGSKPNKGNIYRTIVDDNVYVKSIPRYGSNFRKMSIINPHELNNRPQFEENSYYSSQIPSHKRKSSVNGNLFAINNINKYNNQIDCNSNSDVIMLEQSNTLLEKPLFIQKRLHDLIMGRTIYLPMTTAKIERFIIPDNKGEVHVSNYPIKRVPYKEPINIKESLNVPKSPSFLSLRDNISTTTTLPDHANPTDVKESTRIKTNAPDISKIVRFNEPVHSRYSYKNIYQTQPNQNTIVSNDHSQVTPSAIETVPPTKSAPFKTDSKGLPTDFFFLPPISTEKAQVYVPLNMKKPTQENLSGDNNVDVSLKNNPIVILDQKDKRKDQTINLTKQRGDIPDFSL